MKAIKFIIFIYYILIVFFKISYSQVWVYKGEPIPLEYISYYYTDLPYEFRIAPLVKEKKINSYEVKLVYPNEKHYSGYVEFKNEYDTNGIPLHLKGMNYDKYSTGGHHFDAVFNVDSTYYHINNSGKLEMIIRYYQTGRIDTSTFAYNSKGLYIGPHKYILDSMNFNWPIIYDEKGRMIKKGNIEFIFKNNRISEVIQDNDNGDKFLKYKYIFDDKKKVCKSYEIRRDTVLKEIIYCDDDWKSVVRYDYYRGSRRKGHYKGANYRYYEYYSDGKLKTIYQKDIKGNILTSEIIREFKYNTRGDNIEETTFDKFGNLIDKYIFIYEYYE